MIQAQAMGIKRFPPVSTSDDETGLLAIGGDVEIESLLLAYRSGIFPWPVTNENVLLWFAPKKRALLFLSQFHASKRLLKEMGASDYRFTIDSDFEKVIFSCAESGTRRSQGTWVTPEIIKGYVALHNAGYAHSIECWDGERLIGGLYGVSIGRMFAGESMFFVEPNASKMCLCYLVDHLKKQNVPWIDCQQLTPLLESFGAMEIPQDDFMKLLDEAVNAPVDLFALSNSVKRM